MAVLKDLIVHGASRFLSKSYFDSLEADSGAFKKIIAKDATVTNATVMGLLDVTGELHTKSWSNSNIATIDGSFYITPTFGLQGGDTSTNTVTVAATSLSFTNSSGTNFNFDSLYLDGSDSAIAWTTSSKVIVTGEILKDGEWIPLGTLKGTLGTYSTTSVVINNITDAKGTAPATLAALIGSGLRYRNVKVSLISINRSGLKPLGIFMTATGANGRTFLDIYGGNNAESSTYAGLSTPVLRIGNLKGLPAIQGITPSGWGIYTTNGFFSGTIVSTKGKIGNFTLDTALHAGTNGGPTSVSGTTAGTYVGTDGFLNYASNTAYVKMTGGVITAVGAVIKGALTATSLTAGTKTSSTSGDGFYVDGSGNIYVGNGSTNNFTVTAAGTLNATGATISGAITASSLTISSGATISGDGASQILNSELEGALDAANHKANPEDIPTDVSDIGNSLHYATENYVDNGVDGALQAAGGVQNNLDQYKGEVQGELGVVDNRLDSHDDRLDEHDKIAQQVVIDTGDASQGIPPSIKMWAGQSSGEPNTYLKIVPSKLAFVVDGIETAYSSADVFSAPSLMTTNIMMRSTNASGDPVGELGWVMRSDGHLSLKVL